MRKFKLTAKKLDADIALNAPKRMADADLLPNMMLDPRYLRQSATIIQDALQKGFDVLQLATGDIVATGTKTIVNKYIWDDEKGKLVKQKPEANKEHNEGDCVDSSEENEDLSEDA